MERNVCHRGYNPEDGKYVGTELSDSEEYQQERVLSRIGRVLCNRRHGLEHD
jgi:hypothetical protein